MTSCLPARNRPQVVLALAAALSCAVSARAADPEIEALRAQIEAQRAQLEQQSARIERQREALEAQSRQIEALASRLDAGPAGPEVAMAQDAPPRLVRRDEVADLNSALMETSEIPGIVRTVSGDNALAIGGFIKNVMIVDSDAGSQGASMLPSTFGLGGGEDNGQFAMDATLSRVFLDAQAETEDGDLRGYVEVDFNGRNDGQVNLAIRHAYGTWSRGDGTLTLGHTWSTFMHMATLPLGLTEPTVSGAAFTRQPQLRWTQRVDDDFSWSVALEDASSNDVFTNAPSQLGTTNYPDGVVAFDFRRGTTLLRLSGLVRDLEVRVGNGTDRGTLGWGAGASLVLRPTERDKLAVYGVYGEALGRYMVGITPRDGSALDPADVDLKARDNWGGFASLTHDWNAKWRSSLTAGYARAEPLSFQPGSTLDNTQYGAVNLFWSVLPNLTIGAEYSYGRRENDDGSDLDNHRVMLGVQAF